MSLAMLFVPLIAWPLFKLAPPCIFLLSLPITVAGLMLLSIVMPANNQAVKSGLFAPLLCSQYILILTVFMHNAFRRFL